MQPSDELSLMTTEDLLQYIEDAMFIFQQELARRYDGKRVERAENEVRGDFFEVRHVKVVEGEVLLEVVTKKGDVVEVAASSMKIYGEGDKI